MKNFSETSSKYVKAIAAGILAFSLLSNPLASITAEAKSNSKVTSNVELRVMGTTDIHTNLADYDYYQDKPTEEYGLARTASLIKQARKEAPNNLLFDNGDLIQGTPLGDYKATESKLKKGEVHPVFQAMKVLKYDAATLGNHEFNYGVDYLKEVLNDAPFPYVSANIYKYDGDKKESNDKNAYKPYKIIKKTVKDTKGKKQTIKVGVIGLITPQIVTWDSSHLSKKLITKDIVKTAKKFIPQMKKEGADIVIALAHSGYGDDISEELEENAVYQLSKVKDVNGIVFGHSHKVFPSAEYATSPGADIKKGTINGVAAIQSGQFGSHLGYIDYKLKKSKGKWSITNTQSTVKAIYDTANKKALVIADKSVNKAIEKAHKGTITYVNKEVGTTTASINSYFALIQDDPSIQLVNNAQKWYLEKTLASSNSKYKDLPVLSAGAPFKAGGRNGASYYTNIPVGSLKIKNVADLYVYPNTMAAVVVTGKGLKEWLEMSAGQFNQIDTTKTEEQDLINTNFPTYNYDVIDGVTYEIDVTQPAKYDRNHVLVNEKANRIKNLQYDGKVVADEQQFVVATNNYRGSGPFPGVKDKVDLLSFPDENRQVIIDYIISQKVVNPSADNNWTFTNVPNVKATFTTSQNAKALAENISKISFLKDIEDSFAKYKLELSK